jgi:hypothetical protein
MKAKEEKPVAGVFQIRNIQNHKAFVDSTRNVNTLNGQKFMLEHRSHSNQSLQREWDECGPEAFVFEVLEVLQKTPDKYYDLKDSLKKLMAKWIQQLQPFGDRGYNR